MSDAPMTCDRARLALSSFSSDGAPPDGLPELERHLEGCAECRRIGVGLFRQHRALTEMAAQQSMPEMAAKLRQTLAGSSVRPATTRRRTAPPPGKGMPPRMLLAVAVAAAALVALAVWFFSTPQPVAPAPWTDDTAAIEASKRELARRQEALRKAEEERRRIEEERRLAQEKLEAFDRERKRVAALEAEAKEKALKLDQERVRIVEELARKDAAEKAAREEVERAEEARRKALAEAAVREEKRAAPEPPRTVAAVARIESVGFQGDVVLVTDKGRVSAEAGQGIAPGQAIEVGPASMVTVRFPDDTRIEILENTKVEGMWERGEAQGRRVHVTKGAVIADVTKQPAGRPMMFETPMAHAKVLGTSLRLVIDPASTRLDVREGRVELKRQLDGKSVEVVSGHYAIAAPGTELQSRLTPDDRKKKKKLTPEESRTDAAIQKAVTHLRGYAGAFTPPPRQSNHDELVLLALLHAGVPENDPLVQKLVSNLLIHPLERTYSVALTAMAFEALDRVKYQGRIAQCAQHLIDNQGASGQWGYGEPTPFLKDVPTPKKVATPGARVDPNVPLVDREKPKVVTRIALQKRKDGAGKGDNSNTQYAILGLRACVDAGIVLPEEVFVRARDFLLKTQRVDGGWDYEMGAGASYGSMTAGALGSLGILDCLLGMPWLKEPAVKKGMQWLGDNFSASANPGIPKNYFGASGDAWLIYYLYAVERAGMLLGSAKFGDHDWYAEGSQMLLGTQNGDGSWTSPGQNDHVPNTSWVILFLRRATLALSDVPTEDRYFKKR